MAEYRGIITENLEGFRLFFPSPNPSFYNPEFEKASMRVLIVRLSPLQNIKGSITHHFLFQEVRSALPSAYVDYAFFPNPKNIQLFYDNRIPLFLGIQSLRPISDFDLVLVSNSFSLELFNLPYLFLNSTLPALKSERKGIEKPIIVMGGSNALMAQGVISPEGDSFIDALFFGEGEGEVRRIITILHEGKSGSKGELLRMIEDNVSGFFDIRMPIPGNISISQKEPSAMHILTDYPILNTDVEGKVKLQITQGCPCFCSFCFEGNTRKPFREYASSDILAKALEAKSNQAAVEIDLLSFNFNMHSGISKIIADLNEVVKYVNFKSQRADILALRTQLLDIEVLSGKRSFTIGVEGVSDRMRRYLHKSLTEYELLVAIENIYAKKPRQIKLFFIITGMEEESDLRGFRDFVKKIKQLRSRLAPRCRTIMSFGLLVNLPFTPLQFKSTIKDVACVKQIKGELKRDCETNGFEFRMAQDADDFLISQHIVLAGHECFNIILEFAKKGGYFDGKYLRGDKKSLLNSLRSASKDINGQKSENYSFPLEMLRGTPDKKFLYRMYGEALRFLDTGYCLEGKGKCIGCGGCEDHRLSAIPGISEEDEERLKRMVELKKKPQTVQALVTIKEAGRFLTPEAKCAFIGRAILKNIPSLAKSYLSCRQVQNIVASKGYGALFGRFLYVFEFTRDADVLSESLAKAEIETSLLKISPANQEDLKEYRRFRITSKWEDRNLYSFQNRFQNFLFENGMGFEIRKSDGATYFDVAAKDKKKNLLYSAALRQEKSNVSLEIETGSRFTILSLLKYLFGAGWLDAKAESI